MPVENHIYDRRFFRNTIKLEGDSAAYFVQAVLRYFRPLSVVDIGCGAGIYLKEFLRQGVENIKGLDGASAAAEEFVAGAENLEIFDLTKPYRFSRRYDLALCLEVAEHLPEESADVLVDTVCGASDSVLFSAAVPGQGPRSIGHINEQPPEYWVEKFKERGFILDEKLTTTLREEGGAGGVVWWIVNNLLVFRKGS